MESAEQAELARLRGDARAAREALQEAFTNEARAAAVLAPRFDLEPSRSVVLRSAASLALECRETREAERLISQALSGDPPEEIAIELRDLLEQVYFARHLELHDLTLQPNEFQLSLAGPAVGFGIASTSDFIDRVNHVESLLYRTAERKTGQPFRERGRVKGKLYEAFQLFISVPRAASFAVSIRLGTSSQLALPGMDSSVEVINEIMDCLELFNERKAAALQRRITDQAYYRNFVALANKIAPDGDEIVTVGLTSLSATQERRLALSTPRKETHDMALPSPEEPRVQRITVRGTLKYADHRKEDAPEIRLIDAEGKSYRVQVPAGMMTDIVRPLWEDEVIVTGVSRRAVIVLESIDRAG
jgi:hypothetical protein